MQNWYELLTDLAAVVAAGPLAGPADGRLGGELPAGNTDDGAGPGDDDDAGTGEGGSVGTRANGAGVGACAGTGVGAKFGVGVGESFGAGAGTVGGNTETMKNAHLEIAKRMPSRSAVSKCEPLEDLDELLGTLIFTWRECWSSCEGSKHWSISRS